MESQGRDGVFKAPFTFGFCALRRRTPGFFRMCPQQLCRYTTVYSQCNGLSTNSNRLHMAAILQKMAVWGQNMYVLCVMYCLFYPFEHKVAVCHPGVAVVCVCS